MFNKKLIVGFFFFFWSSMICQGQQDSCSCLLNLNYAIEKVESNYAGFKDKVNPITKKQYNQLVDSLKTQSKSVENIGECRALLEKYRQFFYDKHLQLGYKRFQKNGGSASVDDTLEKAIVKKSNTEVGWKMLPDGTLYIQLKSCKLYNKPILDSLLKINKGRLKTIKNWIIDFRGNTGGATDVFSGLLPYLYTKPYISSGNSNLITKDAAKRIKDFLDKNEKLLDAGTKNTLKSWLDFSEEKPGQWYIGKKDTLAFDTVLKYPERVAVLSDKYNGSSGETFLIVAKGISDKVTLFGENSAGFLDYGDLLPYQLPCASFSLRIPSRRANYLDQGISYDKNGYPPDVPINKDTKDWIEFVQQFWKQKK